MAVLWDKLYIPRIRYGLLILAYIAAIFYITRFVSLSGFWCNYVLPSLLWGGLALTIYYIFPKVRPAGRISRYKLYCWLALVCGLIGIVASVASGMMGGFGRSPYDHSLIGMGINLFYLGSMLVGMEVSRAWLVNGLFSKNPAWGISVSALIFTLFTLSIRRLFGLETFLEGAEFLGGNFLPALMESALASYLVFLGGPLPAIIYRGMLMGFQWFSPILPDPNWLTEALFGSFAPVLGIVLVQTVHRSEVLKIRRKPQENITGWIAASAVSILMIWFAVGVFSFFPNVIVSGSMSPAIEIGDVVIVEKIHPEEAAKKVKVGDVIQFRDEDIKVTHRVIDIEEDDRGLPLFITQGDDNPGPDSDPVEADQFVGKVETVIPKVGWATIMMRSAGSSNEIEG